MTVEQGAVTRVLLMAIFMHSVYYYHYVGGE